MNWTIHTLTIRWNGSWSWRLGFNSSKNRDGNKESWLEEYVRFSNSWAHGFAHAESWGLGDTSSVMDEVM